MNKQIAKKWADALASNRFKKGGNALQSDDTYCCLGVLCKLAEDEGVRVFYSPENASCLAGSYLDSQPTVMQWAELDSKNGKYEDQGPDNTLALLNDTSETFAPVIKIIETQWEIL